MLEGIIALPVAILFIPLLAWAQVRRSRSRLRRLAMELMERRRESFRLIFGKLPNDSTLAREEVSIILSELNRQSLKASWNRNRFFARRQHDNFLKARRLAAEFGFSVPADRRVVTGQQRRRTA